MTDLVQRFVGVFVIRLMPLSIAVPILENIKNDKITAVLALCCLVWIAYTNAWSKRAVAIYNSKRISWISAYSQSRVYLNTDIMTKLAFLPVIGFIFDNWINRNDPSHSDDREIKITEE